MRLSGSLPVLEERILSRTRGEFTDREIEGLAGPVLRYFRAAIAIGPPPSANGFDTEGFLPARPSAGRPPGCLTAPPEPSLKP